MGLAQANRSLARGSKALLGGRRKSAAYRQRDAHDPKCTGCYSWRCGHNDRNDVNCGSLMRVS
jgi:hypothetical protein